MVRSNITLRVVICDIYGTLLAVKSLADAENRWLAFWNSIPGMKRQMHFGEFSATIQKIIAREHAAARARGTAQPEIIWSRVVEEAVPELAAQPPKVREALLQQQSQLIHNVTLMPGAADALRAIHSKGISLGLASNSQSYTLRELTAALVSAGLSRDLFEPSLCFFSFEHGFSKPDPAVLQLLAERLQKQAISVGQALMIGNRVDNDIIPARAAGWQTWHFTEEPSPHSANAGNWDQFRRWLG